jgi:hypothetical protein
VDPITNPFAPGAGQAPPALVGREVELDAARVVLDRLADRRPARGLLFIGVRGVGKTVLLNEVRRAARDRGWVVAKVEASRGQPLRRSIAQGLNASLRTATGQHRRGVLDRALAVFKSFSLTASPDGSLAIGIDIDPAGGLANTGDLEIDLTELLGELGATAAELGIGVAILIDELQDLTDAELGAIAGALHDVNQQGLPVTVFGAGLPNVPAVLAAAKSYAERLFDVRAVGPLTDEYAAAALTEPTLALDVEWEPSALRATLDVARGYPYFLQVYGKCVWDFASAAPIARADADAGIVAGTAELGLSFFGARWERASPAQQHYLRALAAVADVEGRGTTSAVADQLGTSLGSLSSTRDQLLRKGILYAPDRGAIAFTTPGMAEFITAIGL